MESREELKAEVDDIKDTKIRLKIELNNSQFATIKAIDTKIYEKDSEVLINTHSLTKQSIKQKTQRISFMDLKPQTFYEVKIEAGFTTGKILRATKLAYTLSGGHNWTEASLNNKNMANTHEEVLIGRNANQTQAQKSNSHVFGNDFHGSVFENDIHNSEYKPDTGVCVSEKLFVKNIYESNDRFS